jgi:hypothetical protein
MMCKRTFLFAFAVLIILLEFFSYQAIARKIWIQAEDYEEIEGNMANGSDVGVEDEEALGDFVLPTASSAAGDNPEWYVQYTVRIPEDGTWFLWGRYKHPNAGGYSFCLDGTGEGPNPGDPRLYNSTVGGDAWCWDSNLEMADASPIGAGANRITMQLSEGSHTFRVYAREAPGDVQSSPRMDIILLTNEPSYVPSDEDAEIGLETKAVFYRSDTLATTWGSVKFPHLTNRLDRSR